MDDTPHARPRDPGHPRFAPLGRLGHDVSPGGCRFRRCRPPHPTRMSTWGGWPRSQQNLPGRASASGLLRQLDRRSRALGRLGAAQNSSSSISRSWTEPMLLGTSHSSSGPCTRVGSYYTDAKIGAGHVCFAYPGHPPAPPCFGWATLLQDGLVQYRERA